jgi:hypothetical protein
LIPPYIRAQRLRSVARLRAAHGDHDGVEADLRAAVEAFQALGYDYWVAVVRTDLAEWLVENGRAEEAAPLIAEAEPVLVGLGVRPALERLRAAARERV